MVLRDKIQIERPPDQVWRYLQSPVLMKEWNGKIKAVVPVSWGEPAEGFRYRVRYRTNSRESNFLAEFLEYQEPARLVIHLSGGDLPVKGYIQEIYELTANTGGTLLRQRTEVHNPVANIFSRCLIFLGHYCFGIFSGKKHLRRLKELIEAI